MRKTASGWVMGGFYCSLIADTLGDLFVICLAED